MKYGQILRRSALVAALGIGLTLPAVAETAAPTLADKFAKVDQTLEYHFTLKAPAFTEKNAEEVLNPWLDKLKVIGEVGKLEKPKEGAYLDTRDRLLDRAHLIVRLRKGLFTIKARSTNLDELVDLKNCFKPKYEQDYFEDIGYSISVEIRHEKEEWIPDPTKATMAQSMEFLKKKGPPLFEQLEVILKPVSDLTAPGVARMWSAEFKPTHPLAGGLKESGISAWTFPGTDQTLVEVAWTGYMKDRAELDQLYFQVKERLDKAGLLAVDQSSKTERYFHAYYGATALDTRYGFLAPPAYVKYFEADPKDQVIPSPYQQIASREFPGYLETDLAPYDWVIDADGHVAFVPETMAPYGRVYEKGFVRPEDKSKKKPGTEEHYGHVAALGGMPGRISGEILFDKKLNAWVVNNKSGRYSKNNPDRTPEQLVQAAKLIQQVIDPAGVPWGPVRFIFEYGPASAAADLEKTPGLAYEDAAKKSRPYIEVMASKAPPVEKKPKGEGDKKAEVKPAGDAAAKPAADAEKKPKAEGEKKPKAEKP